MILRPPAAALVLAAALAAAAPAAAHHSFAMFDNQKEVVLEGTVREFQFTNPHVWIQLTVAEGGRTVEYSVEGTGRNGLIRRGWSGSSLKPGDSVKIVVHPLKTGGRGGALVRATLADGRTLGY